MSVTDKGNLVGAGEVATVNILGYLTKLPIYATNKHFGNPGIFTQIPINWLYSKSQMINMKQEMLNSSIDIFIIYKAPDNSLIMIAVRVQGKGHGMGEKHHGRYSLKNPIKVQEDKLQKQLLQDQKINVVDIEFRECPNVFKERTNQLAINEIISSFKTAGVMIPNYVDES